MKTIEISDFEFRIDGYGAYKVTYKSPLTGKKWTTRITDMQLIDVTKNSDDPKKKDLEMLKRRCKNS
jgi:hypothetical protein